MHTLKTPSSLVLVEPFVTGVLGISSGDMLPRDDVCSDP